MSIRPDAWVFSEVTLLSSPVVGVVHPEFLTIIQREFAHDVAAVVLRYEVDAPKRYETGTPVTIKWGVPNGVSALFIGYVNHVEPVVTPKDPQQKQFYLRIICAGATWMLNNGQRRVWLKRTIPSVVQEIADEHRLSVVLGDHSQIWDSLVQGGESDWAFLCSLAKKIGWTIFARNTDLHFHDPMADFSALCQEAARFVSTAPSQADRERSSVRSFRPLAGDLAPVGGLKADRVATVIDPRQVTALTAQDDGMGMVVDQPALMARAPFFSGYETLTAQDTQTALAMLDGITRENRWSIQAQAEVRGHAGVAPGCLVAFDHVGVRHNGYWYVQQVEHEVSIKGYTLQILLGRDSQWDTGGRPPAVATRAIRHRLSKLGESQAETPPPTLVNNTWQAAYGATCAV